MQACHDIVYYPSIIIIGFRAVGDLEDHLRGQGNRGTANEGNDSNSALPFLETKGQCTIEYDT